MNEREEERGEGGAGGCGLIHHIIPYHLDPPGAGGGEGPSRRSEGAGAAAYWSQRGKRCGLGRHPRNVEGEAK